MSLFPLSFSLSFSLYLHRRTSLWLTSISNPFFSPVIIRHCNLLPWQRCNNLEHQTVFWVEGISHESSLRSTLYHWYVRMYSAYSTFWIHTVCVIFSCPVQFFWHLLMPWECAELLSCCNNWIQKGTLTGNFNSVLFLSILINSVLFFSFLSIFLDGTVWYDVITPLYQ